MVRGVGISLTEINLTKMEEKSMTRLDSMILAVMVEREFKVKTRAGFNCMYFTPNHFLGHGDKERDKIEHVEDLTTAIVDFIRETKRVMDCYCTITGEEVKINFIG